MNVLVYSEGWSGAPDQDALGVLSKAFSLGEPVTAVVCGGAAEEFMPVFASHGAGRVLAVQDRSFAEPVYTSRVDALEAICRRHDIDVLLFPTTALTVDVAASLAMRLEAGLCWGLVDVEIADGDLIGKRLAENDTVVAELKWTTRVKIGLFRPHVLEPMIVVGPAPEVEILLLDLPHRAAVPRLIEMKPREAGNDLALDRADIVVSGGRGLEKPEESGSCAGIGVGAGWRHRRIAAARRDGLGAAIHAGWTDRHHRQTAPLFRLRHFRPDAAPGRHGEFRNDHRD